MTDGLDLEVACTERDEAAKAARMWKAKHDRTQARLIVRALRLREEKHRMIAWFATRIDVSLHYRIANQSSDAADAVEAKYLGER